MGARSFALAIGLGCLCTSALADYAVVVGVQKYKNLPADASLSGCVSDAEEMAKALRGLGFSSKDIVVLRNEGATRKAILDAIGAGAKKKPNERFVFYFAGHGRQQPQKGLLPFDAEAKPTYDITPDLLKDALDKVPSVRKTVILDSCFSGSFQEGARGALGKGMRARTWPPVSGERGTFIGAPKANNLDAMALGDKKTCYLTATTGYEAAMEQNFDDDGKVHGVFTHTLVKEFESPDKPPASRPWGRLVQTVRTKLMQQLQPEGAQQTPLITGAFQKIVVLGGPSDVAPDEPPDPHLLEFFNHSQPDVKSISLAMTPNKGEFQVGEHLALGATVGASGYLVIIDYDGKTLKRLFPLGTRPRSDPPPSVFSGYPDLPATEHVKAFLFPTAEQAKAIMDQVPDGDTLPFDLSESRTLQVDISPDKIFTSELEFSVSNKLIGGRALKAPEKLASLFVKADDPLTKAFLGVGQFPLANGKGLEAALLSGFNRLIGAGPKLTQGVDFVALGVKLRPETKSLLDKKEKSSEDWLALNRMLVEDSFPELCDPMAGPGAR